MIRGQVVPVTELVIGKAYWWTAASAIIEVRAIKNSSDLPTRCLACNKYRSCGHQIYILFWQPPESTSPRLQSIQKVVQAFCKGDESNLLIGSKCDYSQFVGGQFIEMLPEQVTAYLL